MRKLIMSVFVFSCLLSCNSLESDYQSYLDNGLDNFENTRTVNGNLVQGLTIEKIAFIKRENNKHSLAIMLNKDALASDVANYTWSIHSYLNKDEYAEILEGKKYVSTPIKPEMETINGHNYVITDYDLKVARLEQIQFFLSGRDKFVKLLSKRVTVKNIGI